MNSYERKTPEDLDCGLRVFGKVLGAKWKTCIMAALKQGDRRPSEIHRRFDSVTPRVLDMQLSELEAYGMVSKRIYPGFPLRVEYFLTEMGASALPVIEQMDRWGSTHADSVKTIARRQSIALQRETPAEK